MATTIGIGGFNTFAFNEEEFNAKPEVTIEWVQQQIFNSYPQRVPQTSQLAAMSGSSVLAQEPQTGWMVQQPGPRRTELMPTLAFIANPLEEFIAPLLDTFTLINVVGSIDTSFILEGMEAVISGLVGFINRQKTVTAENKISIDAVGSEAVVLNIEGEEGVSTRTVTGFANRVFKITGEYQPTRSAKGGSDG